MVDTTRRILAKIVGQNLAEPYNTGVAKIITNPHAFNQKHFIVGRYICGVVLAVHLLLLIAEVAARIQRY